MRYFLCDCYSSSDENIAKSWLVKANKTSECYSLFKEIASQHFQNNSLDNNLDNFVINIKPITADEYSKILERDNLEELSTENIN